jgi:hypothetical protein
MNLDIMIASVVHDVLSRQGERRRFSFGERQVESTVKRCLGCCLALVFVFSASGLAQQEWSVASSSFREGRSDPFLREQARSVRDMGGLVTIRLENPGSNSLKIQDIEIGGKPIQGLLTTQQAFWWRQRPSLIEPGKTGVVEICGNGDTFPLSRKPILIKLEDDQGHGVTTGVVIHEEKIIPSYLFLDQDALWLFVRNDDPFMRYSIQSLVLNGVEQSCEVLPKDIGPHDMAVICVKGFTQIKVRDLAIVQLKASDISGKEVQSMRACSLLDPRFPIGTWQNGEAFETDEYRKALQDLRIDCPFMDLPQIGGNPDYYLKEFLDQYGFRPMAGRGSAQVDDNTLAVTFDPVVLQFLREHGEDPRIMGYNVAEEPDNQKAHPKGYSNSYVTMRIAESFREVAPRHPIVGTLCGDRRFYEYAPIFDTPIMDAYRVGAPSNDQWPYVWGTFLEGVKSYTWDLKANAEPCPIWVWAQGIHCWTERMFVQGQFTRPFPSPSEARAQLYMQLGAGAKGVLWFGTYGEQGMLKSYRHRFTEGEGSLFLKATHQEDKLEDGLSLYAGYWRELWDAVKDMNLEMCLLRPILSRGDVYPQAWIASASAHNKISLGAIAGLRGLVLYVANLDYDFDPKGYVFHPQSGVRVSVQIPGWLPDLSAGWIIKADQVLPVKVEVAQGSASVDLESLLDGAIILLGPPGLGESLTTDTRSLNP